jgi:hypothetical protein
MSASKLENRSSKRAAADANDFERCELRFSSFVIRVLLEIRLRAVRARCVFSVSQVAQMAATTNVTRQMSRRQSNQ